MSFRNYLLGWKQGRFVLMIFMIEEEGWILFFICSLKSSLNELFCIPLTRTITYLKALHELICGFKRIMISTFYK